MPDERYDTSVRFALPSKGELSQPTLDFLASAGLDVLRPNKRQYIASIPAVPQMEVLFQRAADILSKVEEGSADLGITGYDIVREKGEEHDDVVVLYQNLGYGQCELVLAVPESWIDVASIEDLADLTIGFKEKGKELRIATKYPSLTRTWLYDKGVIHFSLVEAQGALEAAPNMGYADMIADLTTTGTTLRENRLKQLSGGTILTSQACMIGNKRLLLGDADKLEVVKMVLELVEARRRARNYVSITANMRGESPDRIARDVMQERDLAGLRGPSIAKVHSKVWGEDDWYAVRIVIERNKLLPVVDHLRKAGAADITVRSPNYLFESKSWTYQRLIEKLKKQEA